MKQSVTFNKDKLHQIRFTLTRTVRIGDMNEGQLFRILDAMQPTQPYYMQSMTIVQETLEKTGGGGLRPRVVVKAVMLSYDMWKSVVAAHPTASLTFTEIPIVDDFLILEDRINRTILTLAPTQNRESHTTVVSSSVYNLGYSFVESSFDTVPTLLTPPTLNGNAGTVTFDSGDIGTQIAIFAVSQPHYPVVKVIRVEDQPADSNLGEEATNQDPWCVIIHPSLAASLGVTLP